MIWRALGLIVALAGWLCTQPASAQQTVKICLPNGAGQQSCQEITAAFPFPIVWVGQSFVNITTNANTVVKATPGTFVGITVNTGGTTSTATVYDNTTCSGTKIGTFSTTALVSLIINATAATGICVTTAGAGAADITVTYR